MSVEIAISARRAGETRTGRKAQSVSCGSRVIGQSISSLARVRSVFCQEFRSGCPLSPQTRHLKSKSNRGRGCTYKSLELIQSSSSSCWTGSLEKLESWLEVVLGYHQSTPPCNVDGHIEHAQGSQALQVISFCNLSQFKGSCYGLA